MTLLLAYHNDKKIKTKYVQRVRAHAQADEIIKGKYWEGGRGCAVGCTIHSSEHKNYETELGIPQILARLEDSIFEALPLERAKIWPEQFLSAIKPGADLSGVWNSFAIYLLVDPVDGVIQYAQPDGKIAIQNVADLYSKESAADSAAAYSAAYRAAYRAADSAAAYSAAYSAASAAASAYSAASAAYSAYSAYSAASARIKQADKLLELLAAAPVVK